MEKYLSDDILDDDPSSEVLSWWREITTKYQILSLIARDVLVVPIFTMAYEFAFSTGGLIVDCYRSFLSPSMTEALTCAQNWLKPTRFNFRDRDFDQYEESESVASGKVFKAYFILVLVH